MGEQAPLREIRLVLPMAPDMEVVASQAATAVAEFVRMSADKIDEVRMAVVEACINAFEHSHAPDHTLEITFTVLGTPDPESLRITVHDRGVGFAPESLEEPKIEAKLKSERKRGWGIKIIRGLMDEVSIQSGAQGTTVVMCKSR
jgi:serine/threonine-protein kinase RsbW